MSDKIKIIAGSCLIIVWVSLWGICFSEGFDNLHDTDEFADQTIEQILSSPVDLIPSNSDEMLGMLAFVGFISIAAVVTGRLQTIQLTCHNLLIQGYCGPPRWPRIFQFLSTYRI